jgi:hypothetical protein
MTFAMFVLGYENGWRYAARQANDRAATQVRVARLDLFAYLLSIVPLFFGLLILLARDPAFGAFVLPAAWIDFVTGALFVIAAIGAGAGVARRQMSLKIARGH